MKKNMAVEKESATTGTKVLTGVGIALCVILIPILIINCTLIIKSFVNKDDVPDFAGVVPMMVFTESMDPEIKVGDVIFCKVVGYEEIKEGDVISFFDPEGNGTAVVTHKVLTVNKTEEGTTFTTYGINNLDIKGEYDIDNVPVPAENLVGRYTGFRIPLLGYVAMFMQSTWGLIICILVPLAAFAAYEIIRRRKYEVSRGDDIAVLMAELEALKAEKAEKAEEKIAPADIVNSKSETDKEDGASEDKEQIK